MKRKTGIYFSPSPKKFFAKTAEGDYIHIPRADSKGLVPGDEIELNNIKETNGKLTGRLSKIIKRKYKTITGYIEDISSGSIFKPLDKNISFNFYSVKKAEPAMYEAAIINYERRLVRPLKKIQGDYFKHHLLNVLKKYNIERDFKKDVLNAASEIKINPRDVEKRADYKNEVVFTIDPEEAKDLDDAVSVKKLKDGWEIGVHIADVSYFVKENSILDKEAEIRGTSVYPPFTVVPMLPEALSNNLCSLDEGKVSLCFAALFTLDKNFNIKKCQFKETVIKNKKKFSYKEIDALLNNEISSPLKKEIMLVKKFTDTLEKERYKAGSVDFDLPEVGFKVNNIFRIDEIELDFQTPAQKIIELLMIKTNEEVAKYMSRGNYPSIYRIHEPPAEDRVWELYEGLKEFKLKFNFKKNIHPKDIQRIVEKIQNLSPQESTYLKKCVLRTMSQAKYSEINKGHFGLALNYYCHFTSPIRRYPDIWVHRCLKRALAKNKMNNPKLMKKISLNSSKTERNALDAERECIKLLVCEYLQMHIGKEFTGLITKKIGRGAFVDFNMGIEGFCRISGDKIKEVKPAQKINMRLIKVDMLQQQIDFELL